MSDSSLTRREAIAALACSTTLPLLTACNREPTSPAAPASPDAAARALLDQIGDGLLQLAPETATPRLSNPLEVASEVDRGQQG